MGIYSSENGKDLNDAIINKDPLEHDGVGQESQEPFTTFGFLTLVGFYSQGKKTQDVKVWEA